MAGLRLDLGGHLTYIDFPDSYGEAIVNGRLWRWEFHNYLGPTFLKKNGEPRKCQYPKSKDVWAAFSEWLNNKENENRRN